MNLPPPMLLEERSARPPFGEPDWIYEIKYDGHRVIAGIVGRMVQLRSRGGLDYTGRFPEVARDLGTLGDGPHILDGEVVVLDPHTGRSLFDPLQARASRSKPRATDPPAVLMAFDALMIDGRALVNQPVEERKAALMALLGQPRAALQYVEHFAAEQGKSLYHQAAKLMLEGLVGKRLGSVYAPGERSADWVKVKRPGAVPPERFKR